eukprot:gene43194-4604_t
MPHHDDDGSWGNDSRVCPMRHACAPPRGGGRVAGGGGGPGRVGQPETARYAPEGRLRSTVEGSSTRNRAVWLGRSLSDLTATERDTARSAFNEPGQARTVVRATVHLKGEPDDGGVDGVGFMMTSVKVDSSGHKKGGLTAIEHPTMTS